MQPRASFAVTPVCFLGEPKLPPRLDRTIHKCAVSPPLLQPSAKAPGPETPTIKMSDIDLSQRIQELPPELFNPVFDYVVELEPPDTKTEEPHNYPCRIITGSSTLQNLSTKSSLGSTKQSVGQSKLPTALYIDRERRRVCAESYFSNKIFIFTSASVFLKFVSAIDKKHLAHIPTFRIFCAYSSLQFTYDYIVVQGFFRVTHPRLWQKFHETSGMIGYDELASYGKTLGFLGNACVSLYQFPVSGTTAMK